MITERIKTYTKDINYPNITLYGTFSEKIINEIYLSSRANGNSLSQSVTIISTDYNDLSPELTKKIFDSEARLNDKYFSHKFNGFRQNINVFKASNIDNNKHILILFWKKNKNDNIGIEIRNSSFDIDIEDVLQYSFSMNINDGQKDEIENTLSDIIRLWEPLKNGFFKPIFPPTDNKIVNEEWRKAILQNFNDFALRLIKSEEYTEMKITWNLTENSLDDYINFKEWIDNQFQIVVKAKNDNKFQFKVTRYFLIDSNKYKNNENYHRIVNEISTIFINKKEEHQLIKEYQLKYVDTKNISNNLKNDYAYLFGDSERIIQSSDINSTPGVLKVFFSKNKDVVDKIEKKFKILESKKRNIFSKLTEFEKSFKA